MCGDYLASQQNYINHNSTLKSWITYGQSASLAGISHGAAGIALALMKLYGITQNKKYLDLAMKGIDYENSLFNQTESNWQDLRKSANSPGTPAFASTWCNGAPGIGLARLECWRNYKDDRLLRDVYASIDFINHTQMADIDHLCCGNFGRLETLRVASQILNDRSYLDKAKRDSSLLIIGLLTKLV